MAITIAQQPSTGIYLSGGEHIYIASTNITGQKQHSIVAKVYVGTTLYKTFKKPVNAASAAVFDFAKVFDSQLETYQDPNILGAWVRNNGSESTALFQVRFNEEYLVGSTLTEANSSDVSSASIRLIKGGVDFYNTDTRIATTTEAVALVPMGIDTETVEINENQRFWCAVYGSQYRLVLNAGGSDVVFYTNTNTNKQLSFIDCGSTRAFASAYLNGRKDYYTVTVQDTANSNAVVDSFRLNIVDEYDRQQDTQLIWYSSGIKNFHFTRDHSETTNVTKDTYRHSHIDYNAATYNKVNNRVFGSGESVENIDFRTTYTINSRWLDENTMQYLDTIYAAENVWLVDGVNWIPITITGSSFQGYRNNRNPELQNRTITYRRATNKQLR